MDFSSTPEKQSFFGLNEFSSTPEKNFVFSGLNECSFTLDKIRIYLF